MGRQANTTLRAAARRVVPIPALINPNAPGVTIPLDMAGLSFETSHVVGKAFAADANLINVFKPLGARGSLRVGGASSDAATYPSTTNLQSLADFIIALGTGWSLVYGLNYQRNEPDIAAQQAKTLTDKLGVNRVVFQIGNEPDLYNGGAGVAFSEYQARWQSIHDAVVAQVPGARFGGPDVASTNAKANEFCRQFATNLGSQAVELTRHLYGAGVTQPEASNLNSIWANRTAYWTASKIFEYASAAGLKARMTEGGSINGSGNFKIASTLGASLWCLETLAVLAQAGWAGFNFHGAPNNNPNIPIVNGYGPIRLEADGTYRPLPTLFAMLAFRPLQGGRFVPITGKLTADCPAWGVLGADGRTRVLAVNKSRHRTAQINLTSTASLTRGASYLLTGSHWSSPRATFGGATVGPDGSFAPVPAAITATGAALPIVIPPASAALVELF